MPCTDAGGSSPSEDPIPPGPRPEVHIPSALESLESTVGPVPRVLLRDDDGDGDAPTVEVAPDGDEPASPSGPGRYTLLGEIARGGMGAVFRGRDSDLNRELAIKVLLEKYAANPVVLGRFVEEAQIGGQLQHPGIVPVYELGRFPDDRPFFAMKLVKGRTLADLLKDRASPADDLPRFLRVFGQICETMAYAHSRGVIHRDLKPLNVMVGAFGEVQVMDWGLAKVLGRAEAPRPTPEVSTIRTRRSENGSDPTEHGDLLGTADYMPPEQARGEIEALDERADVFALGSILCKVLTGSAAYTGRSHSEIVTRAMIADLADARSRLHACGAEPGLIAIATACLAPIAEDRPRDAGAVAGLVTAHLSGVQERLRASEIARAEADARAEAEEARAEAEARRAASERARRRATMALAAATILAVLTGGGSWMAFRLDRDARLNESDRLVGTALATARALRGEAERAGPEALDAWGRALEAADRAKGLLMARPPRAALARDVARAYDEIAGATTASRERVRQVEADRQLVAELDEARLQETAVKESHFDTESKLTAYMTAFRKAGVEFGKQSAEEIVARLRPKGDVQRIAAALDDWAWYGIEKDRKELLNSVAAAIDPERNPLRAAIRKQDRAELLAMAREPAARRMPASTACFLARVLSKLGDRDEAMTLLMAARASSPADFWINHDLGMLLGTSKKPAETSDAVRFLTVAAALKPDSPGVLLNLGATLADQGKPVAAIDAYREAIRLKPDYAMAHNNLGYALAAQGEMSEAIDAYREAIRLKPDYAMAHDNLGYALATQGKLGEAIIALRDAIRLRPDSAEAHSNLGIALNIVGEPAAAIDACREAIRLKPNLAEAHHNLGVVLSDQGEPAAAIDAYREAIRLRPDYAMAHYNLGIEFKGQGQPAAAIDAYREAIRLRPDYAEAHSNLGRALRSQGRFGEALAELRRGHELGSKQPDWEYPSAEWVAECEVLVALEARLPALLRGDDSPKDNAERLALGQVGYATKRFAASARFFGDALAEDPKLGDDREAQHRYTAACSASLAGTGQGKDDPKPDDAARARLRKRARDWLRAELSAWEGAAGSGESGDKKLVAGTLRHWKADADLAGVREAEPLATLPEQERAAWRALWADVDALLAKAEAPG